jgi:ABC-type sugar transport system ATPase subunit
MAAGIAYLPEDRRTQGLFPYMSTAENITASLLRRHTRAGVLDLRALKRLARDQIDTLRIKVKSPDDPVMSLSGGHQQKSLLARWLATQPRLAILDEPTRGIDVGTKTEIQTQIMALADTGVAVVVISSELPELLAVSDRILVMREGRVQALLSAEDRTERAVLRATLGLQPTESPVMT